MGGTGSRFARLANARQAEPEARGTGLRRLGTGAGEPHQGGPDPLGKGERTVGSGPGVVGAGGAEQPGVGDRSGGARGEARFGVGQRISVGWAGAAR